MALAIVVVPAGMILAVVEEVIVEVIGRMISAIRVATAEATLETPAEGVIPKTGVIAVVLVVAKIVETILVTADVIEEVAMVVVVVARMTHATEVEAAKTIHRNAIVAMTKADETTLVDEDDSPNQFQ